MTDITLKRSSVASWLRELSMFSNCDPSPMVDAVCEEIATALAAPQPVREPVAWIWVATCGSGAEQVRIDEPIRGFSYKAPLFREPVYAATSPAAVLKLIAERDALYEALQSMLKKYSGDDNAVIRKARAALALVGDQA